MDRAIAAEWGRFLRELETRESDCLENEINNIGDGTAKERFNPGSEGSNQTVLQSLEDSLAIAPAPGIPIYSSPSAAAPAAPAIEKTNTLRPRETADAERSPMEHLVPAPADGARAPWLSDSPADASFPLEPKGAANAEAAKYSTHSQWNGGSFEERRILVTPVSQALAPEPRLTTIQEEAVEQKAPLAPAENTEGIMWKSINRPDEAGTEEHAGNTDAMQAAHGQDASRWFVLKGMLGGAAASEKTSDHASEADVPVLEVFSLAGGVGKTSLVATLGRALSARGERVLLVEATFFGSLQYFFGATDCRPGAVRTFRPPASSSDAPIQLATVDPDALLVESTVQGSLAADVQRWAQGASRIIVDVATGATAIARGLMRKSSVVLVPLIPDVQAVVTATSIDAFFQHNSGPSGERPEVFYLLNQFDPSLPLHLDLREVLREKLGERMLPFALPRTPAIGEALAEGMTIMDYAPDSPATEDFISLAKWLDEVLSPADMNRRGMRWSER